MTRHLARLEGWALQVRAAIERGDTMHWQTAAGILTAGETLAHIEADIARLKAPSVASHMRRA